MITVIKKIQQNTNLSEQEAWWMLEKITQKTKEQLYTQTKQLLTDQEQKTIDDWIYKLQHESIPLAYLIGSVPFLDLTIDVKPPILIPRPETEEWVNQLIEAITPFQESITSILEIGTGSGCIAISIAQKFPQLQITATDINPQALELAQQNANKNNITNITFLKSNLFENISTEQHFDLIVSNPPYINPIMSKEMMPQVTEWEDRQALFANDQGLEIIYEILNNSSQYLRKQSQLPYQLVIEHDYNQHKAIKKHAHQQRWTCSQKQDLFGNWRTSWFTYQNQP